MKKKTVKKLSLSRETLRELHDQAVEHAAGAGTRPGNLCYSGVCIADTNADYAC
jgi:hypothetical protein